jgi:hypothetical protein
MAGLQVSSDVGKQLHAILLRHHDIAHDEVGNQLSAFSNPSLPFEASCTSYPPQDGADKLPEIIVSSTPVRWDVHRAGSSHRWQIPVLLLPVLMRLVDDSLDRLLIDGHLRFEMGNSLL